MCCWRFRLWLNLRYTEPSPTGTSPSAAGRIEIEGNRACRQSTADLQTNESQDLTRALARLQRNKGQNVIMCCLCYLLFKTSSHFVSVVFVCFAFFVVSFSLSSALQRYSRTRHLERHD